MQWRRGGEVRNAHLAVVNRGKGSRLPSLNDAHQNHGGSAQFFESLGFSREDSERLMAGASERRPAGEVKSGRSAHGEKSVGDGWLSAHTQEKP
jgi:hypothetical protein